MILTTTPLDPATFARFGQVLMAETGIPEYNSWAGRVENLRPEARLNVTYMSMHQAPCPARITQFERHPFSHQMFVPLEGTQHLVIVCPSLANGEPDLARIAPFHATGGQTVIYSANVWHTPRTVLNASGAFIMLRWDAGNSMDTEFFDLDLPFDVHYPQ
ncbi:ureidoglycolate lyase [Desulfofustis glycolicus]|uniref:Ureidoglycolate lyase n=1 Tax=Desulfofustis glycolicus DSM 9705 TaxID=1121409 RepID=A0A1M5T963_9BACT|nr:ureidoglycolate lyase [Desulfofustis glycolicus]MCB2215429.1 ureidoglycolate lyase [Desulfobulbaceae bacterium]SHH47307.1 ureidoglycolate lyase [Desulfofustis glycolicus DSM 9705]